MCQGSGGYSPYANTGYGLGGGRGQMGVGTNAFGGATAPMAPTGYYGGATGLGSMGVGSPSQPPFDQARGGNWRPAMPPIQNTDGFSPRRPPILDQMGVGSPTGANGFMGAADQTGGFTPTARPLGSLGGQMGVGSQPGLLGGLGQSGGVRQMATPGYEGMGPLWTTPPGGGPQPPAPPPPWGYPPPSPPGGGGGGGGTGGGGGGATPPGMGAGMPIDLGNAASWMTAPEQDLALQYKYAPQQVRNAMDPVLQQRFGAGFQSTLGPYMSPLAGGNRYDPAAAGAAYKRFTMGLNQYVDPRTGNFLAGSPYANWGK